MIYPKGFLFEMMKDDLENGFVGHLDELVPNLINDDIYDSNRLTSVIKEKN